MGRGIVSAVPAVNGRRVRAFTLAVFKRWGTLCHLCGLPGADTVDHLAPTSQAPHLRWDTDNARPAHGSCNYKRGDAPLATGYQADQW